MDVVILPNDGQALELMSDAVDDGKLSPIAFTLTFGSFGLTMGPSISLTH